MSRLDANPRTSLSPIPRIGQQVAIQSQPLSVPRPLSAGAQQAEEFLAAIGYGVGALAQAAQNENESVRRNEVVHRGEAAKNSSMVLQETYTAIDDKKIDIPTTDEGVHTLVGQLVEKATAGQNEAYADEMRYRITDHLYAALSQARQANAAAVRKETLSTGGSQLVGAVGGERIDSTLEYFKGLGATQDETDQMLLEAMQADLINGDLAAVREKLPYIGDRHPIEIAKLNAGMARVESDNAQAAQENATQRAAYWTDQAEQGNVPWTAAESRIRNELANDPKAMLAAVEHLRVQRDKTASEATQQANANRAAIIDRSKNTVAAHIAKGEFDLADAYISKSTRDPDAPFSGDKPLDATDALELSSKVKAAREASVAGQKQKDIRAYNDLQEATVRGGIVSAMRAGLTPDLDPKYSWTDPSGTDHTVTTQTAIEDAIPGEMDRIAQEEMQRAQAAGQQPSQASIIRQQSEYLAKIGQKNPQWTNILNAGFTATFHADAQGNVTPESQNNALRALDLYRNLKAVNAPQLMKHIDGPTADFYSMADAAFTAGATQGSAAGSIQLVRSYFTDPDAAKKAALQVDRGSIANELASQQPDESWWPLSKGPFKNIGAARIWVEQQAGLKAMMGQDPATAVKSATADYFATHTMIDGYAVNTSGINLPAATVAGASMKILDAFATKFEKELSASGLSRDDIAIVPLDSGTWYIINATTGAPVWGNWTDNAWFTNDDLVKVWNLSTADERAKVESEVVIANRKQHNRGISSVGLSADMVYE